MKPFDPAAAAGSDDEELGIDEGLLYYNDFNNDLSEDLSGMDHHGESRGVITGDGRTDADDDQSAKFRGDRSTFDIPIDINASVHPQLTISCWVNPEDPSVPCMIVSNDNGGYDRTLGIDARGSESKTVNLWSAFNGSARDVLGSETPKPDEWTFLAAVFDQEMGTVRLHVNGKEYKGRGKVGEGNNIVYIGYNLTYKAFYSGLLDDLRIYPRALSAQEIEELRSL